MSQTLDDVYLEFLERQIEFDRPGKFRELTQLMFEKEFVWFVPNDDNRVADGLELREQWLPHVEEALQENLEMNFPCSFLEVLIALSRVMEFVVGEHAEGWAWQLLINLDLHRMRDPLSRYKQRKADDILDTVIFRTYGRDGAGGFFPLGRPRTDQRRVEIWYQMHAYLAEIHPEY